MKRQMLLYPMLFALVSLASCTKEIQFNGDETEPKLVVYSVARAGEPLEVEVSHSAFFLKSGPLSSYIELLKPEEGSVKLYVNDSAIPYVLTRRIPQMIDADGDGEPDYRDLPDAPLYYESAYVPAEGDNLRLVVSFPGFEEASAEVKLPVSSVLTVESATLRPLSEDYYSSYCYYDVAMTVHRGADPTCFYGIRPYLHIKYTYNGEEMEDTYSWNMESDDFLFQGNGSTTDQISQLFSDDDVRQLLFPGLFPQLQPGGNPCRRRHGRLLSGLHDHDPRPLLLPHLAGHGQQQLFVQPLLRGDEHLLQRPGRIWLFLRRLCKEDCTGFVIFC